MHRRSPPVSARIRNCSTCPPLCKRAWFLTMRGPNRTIIGTIYVKVSKLPNLIMEQSDAGWPKNMANQMR